MASRSISVTRSTGCTIVARKACGSSSMHKASSEIHGRHAELLRDARREHAAVAMLDIAAEAQQGRAMAACRVGDLGDGGGGQVLAVLRDAGLALLPERVAGGAHVQVLDAGGAQRV